MPMKQQKRNAGKAPVGASLLANIFREQARSHGLSTSSVGTDLSHFSDNLPLF